MKECPKNRQGNVNQVNKGQSSSVAPPDRLHLDELLLVLAKEKTAFMRSLVAKSKRTF